MKQIIAFLLAFCCLPSIHSQSINNNFPIGHYQIYQKDYLVSANFFENGQMNFSISSGRTSDLNGGSITMLSGVYKNSNGAISLKSDNGSEVFNVFYRNNPDVKKGKVILTFDTASYSYYSMISYTVGSRINEKDFKNLFSEPDSYDPSDNEILPVKKTIEAKPGDTLVLRTDDYNAYNCFYYVVPKNANDLFVRVNQSPVNGLFLDWLTLSKGDSENEIHLSYNDESDFLSLYYTRPVNDSDLKSSNLPVMVKENYTYLNIADSRRIGLKHNNDNNNYDDGDAPVADKADTLKYYTSYQEVLKVAQRENKFMRIYLLPDSSECSSTFPDQFRAISKTYSYDDFNVAKILNENYVFGILSQKEIENLSKYNVKTYPTMLILSPEGILLADCPLNCSESYYGLSPLFGSEMSSYYFPISYAHVLMLYNKLVLSPQMQNLKTTNLAILKKYLDNVFKVQSTSSSLSGSNWSDLNYYMNQYPLSFVEQEIDDSVSTAFLPTSEEIRTYLDAYAENFLNSKADTSIARTMLNYYQNINPYESKVRQSELSPSASYLLKNLEVFEKIPDDQSNFADQNRIVDYLLLALSSNPNDQEEENATPEANPDLYKKAISYAPSYKDIFYMDYFANTNLITNSSSAEDIAFFDAYLTSLMDAPSINKYIENQSKNLFKLMPASFTKPFYQNVNGYSRLLSAENEEGLSENMITTVALMLNNIAWSVYLNNVDNMLPKALQWSAKAIDLCTPESKHIYLDTYAHLLYKSGKKEEAVAKQKEAYEIAKEQEEPNSLQLREIKVEYQLMKLGILGQDE